MADSYALLTLFSVLPPKIGMPKARDAASRAVNIDDMLAEAHTSLGFVKERYEWNWSEAAREYKRAISLNPNYSIAHQYCGLLFLHAEWRQESMAELKRAQELDPLSLPIQTDLAMHSLFTRQYDQAMKQLQKIIDLNPYFARAHAHLGEIYLQKGIYEQAIVELKQAITLGGGDMAGLGRAYALSGRMDEAQRQLEELKELSKRRYVSSLSMAIIYVALGEKDQAIQHLQMATEERHGLLVWLKQMLMFESLHSDPRFADLLRRINLTP